MNAFDLLKILLKQYSSVEELLRRLQKFKKAQHYQDDSPYYYEEVIKILDDEIKDLTKSLNEKIKLKKEFEKKAKDYQAQQESQRQKEKERDKYRRKQEEEYESYSSSYSSGNYSRGSSYSFDEKLAKYYAALEIPYGSNFETVKKAYRNLLKKYHPDFYLHDPEKQKTATHLTQKLSEAYQALEKHLKKK